ncbi:hypothetical protein T484DRAFT_1752681 [Baffinella frigidus]|nr:hypothetical protein T484DRAFT_1752681 [Cryptophyta sp. CCMP2293]
MARGRSGAGLSLLVAALVLLLRGAECGTDGPTVLSHLAFVILSLLRQVFCCIPVAHDPNCSRGSLGNGNLLAAPQPLSGALGLSPGACDAGHGGGGGGSVSEPRWKRHLPGNRNPEFGPCQPRNYPKSRR